MSEDKRPPHLVSQRETWEFILKRPDELELTIVMGVGTGSTLRRIASNFGIPFPWLYEHVVGDPALNRKYEAALVQRKEYMNQWVFDKFLELAEGDIRDSLKMRALDQIAKHIGFVVDKPEDSGKLTWEALIMMSMKAVESAKAKDVIEVAAKKGEEK